MAWFPDDTENSLGWRVQFMGVVAWLGASAIEKHANAMIGSKFSWIPRIVPGPWHFPDAGLVRYDYKTIPTLRAAVCQARPEFPFVGKLANDKIHMVVPEMQDSNSFIPLSIHRWCILYNRGRLGLKKQASLPKVEPVSRYLRICGVVLSLSPTDVLSILSYLTTSVLATLFVMWQDGPALLGLGLICLHTILCSLAIRQNLRHDVGTKPTQLLELVVRTPESAFWIISCDILAYSALVRGSVFAPTDGERREVGALLLPYARSAKRSLLPLLSFILFLFFFSNATDISQIAITAAYIILTSFYIIVRPLGINPGELGVATIYDWLSPTSHLAKPTERYTERLPTIARTVWYAIRLTNSTTWVRPIDAIPDTPEWNQWLEEARKNMKTPDWPAEGEAQRLVDNAQHVYDIQEPRRRSNDQDSLRISPVPEADW